MEKIKGLIKKYINKETILYVVFGLLTTGVNFAVFHLCNKLLSDDVFLKDKNYLFTNVVAWVAAVLFAFFVNKIFVFESKSWRAKTVFSEFIKFVAARVVSLGIDEAGMFLLVSVLGVKEMLSKLAVQVFVVVINYFFSKFIIFKKEQNNKG